MRPEQSEPLFPSSQEYQSSMNLVFVNLLNIINSTHLGISIINRPKIRKNISKWRENTPFIQDDDDSEGLLRSSFDEYRDRPAKNSEARSRCASVVVGGENSRAPQDAPSNTLGSKCWDVPSDWLGDLIVGKWCFKPVFWALPCITIRAFPLSWRSLSWRPPVGMMDSWWL